MNYFLTVTTIAAFILFLYICLAKDKNRLFWATLAWQSIAVVWSFAKLAELHAPTLDKQLIALKFLFSAFNFAGPTWLLFCNYLISKNSKKLYYIFMPSLIFEIIIVFRSDLYFGIVAKQYIPVGLVFALNTVLVCIYGFKGIFLITVHSEHCNEVKKRQIRMIKTAFCAPFFLGIFSAINIVLFNNEISMHHISTAGFSVTVSFVTIAILRYRFLNLASIAAALIVNSLKEPIIVFDLDKYINYYNESFKRQFGIYTKIDEFVKVIYAKITENTGLINAIYNESYTNYKDIVCIDEKVFCVSVATISDNYYSIGKLISFTDVTMYKTVIKSLEKVQINEPNSDVKEVRKMIENEYKNITAKFGDINFTPAEIEIIKLIAQGKGDKEIATLIYKSYGTVRNIISNLLKRTGAENRTKLALYIITHSEENHD